MCAASPSVCRSDSLARVSSLSLPHRCSPAWQDSGLGPAGHLPGSVGGPGYVLAQEIIKQFAGAEKAAGASAGYPGFGAFAQQPGLEGFCTAAGLKGALGTPAGLVTGVPDSAPAPAIGHAAAPGVVDAKTILPTADMYASLSKDYNDLFQVSHPNIGLDALLASVRPVGRQDLQATT